MGFLEKIEKDLKNLTKWLKRNWIKDSDTSGNAIKICKFCNKLLRFGNVKKYITIF